MLFWMLHAGLITASILSRFFWILSSSTSSFASASWMCFQVSRTLSFVINIIHRADRVLFEVRRRLRAQTVTTEPVASDSPPYPSWRPAVAIGSAIPRSERPGGYPLSGKPPWIVVSVDLSLIFGLISGCLPLANFCSLRVFYFPGIFHIWRAFPYPPPGKAPDARLATWLGTLLPTCLPAYLPAYLSVYLPAYLPASLSAECKIGFSTLQEAATMYLNYGRLKGTEGKPRGSQRGWDFHNFLKKKNL